LLSTWVTASQIISVLDHHTWDDYHRIDLTVGGLKRMPTEGLANWSELGPGKKEMVPESNGMLNLI
jgi:hypothetical protein